MKRISRQKVYDVIALLKAGLSVRNIASRTGVSKSSVSDIKKQYNIATHNRAMGRPRKLRIITLRYPFICLKLNEQQQPNRLQLYFKIVGWLMLPATL
jgi:hypothetical protein